MKHTTVHKGKTFITEFLDKTNFEELGCLSQAQCYIFDDKNNICLVDCNHDDKWTIPGGTVEPHDESIEVTLLREILEEADLEIIQPIRIGVVKVLVEKSGDIFYQAKFTAKVKTIHPQTMDPAYNKIPKRKFIPHQEYVGNNPRRKYWINLALNKITS